MTKIIRKLVGGAKIMPGLLAVTALPVFSQERLQIDLEQSLRMALENNESYLIATKEVDKADAQVMEVLAGALPQFSAGLNYIRNWRLPTGVFQINGETVTFKFGTDNNYTANLTVTQPIYSGGRTLTGLKIARLYKKFSRETLRQRREDLKVQVYESFYGALLAREVLKVNEESQKLAEENLAVVEKMYNQGVASEFDLLRARVASANIQPEVIKARNEAELAVNALKNLLGIDLSVELELRDDFDSTRFILPPISFEEGKSDVLENRSEIAMAAYETSVREKMVSLAKAGYRPSLYFSSTLQYQAQFDRGSVFEKKWDRSINSMVVLSVPIFDSWKTPSQVKQARLDMVQSRLMERSIRKAMILDFEQSLGKYLEARKRLAVQGDAVELAKRGLEIARVRYESGVGIQLEVLDASLALSRARINRAVAFHDLATSYAALMRALGRDIEIATSQNKGAL